MVTIFKMFCYIYLEKKLKTFRLSYFFSVSLVPHFDKFERYSPKDALKTVNIQKDIYMYRQTGGQTDTMRSGNLIKILYL